MNHFLKYKVRLRNSYYKMLVSTKLAHSGFEGLTNQQLINKFNEIKNNAGLASEFPGIQQLLLSKLNSMINNKLYN